MGATAFAALATQPAFLVDVVADVELPVDALVAATVGELVISAADLQALGRGGSWDARCVAVVLGSVSFWPSGFSPAGVCSAPV